MDKGNYHSLHHFIHDAPWDAQELNNRRLKILQSCRQTRIKDGFDLIIDDSGHRKSGSATAGVGRQYIGQIGKADPILFPKKLGGSVLSGSKRMARHHGIRSP